MTGSIPLLVTGGHGMLGKAFADESADFPDYAVTALGRGGLDVRDASAVAALADTVRGGWIVHCAGLVDVEGCAREPEAARETIVEGTRNVARLARDTGARLLYPQSFLIYDGHQNPIPEDEQPRPLSFYGELKLAAEEIVQETVEDPLIIRMAGFFGGEAADKNFVGRIIPVMFAAMMRGEREFSVGDRVWQPTWTRDLARNSLALMKRGASGTYQMASHGQATFAELASEIVEALGWSDRFAIRTVDANLVSQSELGRRPDVAVMGGDRLKRENIDLQGSMKDTIHAYLRHAYFDRFRLEEYDDVIARPARS